MPRVPNNLRDNVAFLYRTREDALAHTKSGGSCFLIGSPVIIGGKATGSYIPYMVTNRHVAWNAGCPVIRLNRVDGNPPDIIELECDDWIPHPNGDDLAVACVFGHLNLAIHKVTQSPTWKFITEKKATELEIGVGDEVLMMGRFVNHQGRVDNQAAMRFGSISMMPEPIRNSAIGKDQLSYAVEMRSRTGFSGSPVVVYRTPSTTLMEVKTNSFHGVLGVNWGYILDEDGENTWLNGVVPAWKILETLETPILRALHEVGTKIFVEYMDGSTGGAEPSVAGFPSDAELVTENPHHKEDFTFLLDAAAKVKPQGD